MNASSELLKFRSDRPLKNNKKLIFQSPTLVRESDFRNSAIFIIKYFHNKNFIHIAYISYVYHIGYMI